jgi:hypothetical protein
MISTTSWPATTAFKNDAGFASQKAGSLPESRFSETQSRLAIARIAVFLTPNVGADSAA